MIENCYHRGTLGGDAAGGIAGINGGVIRNCYHAGNCRVVGEYNLGDVVNIYYDADLSGLHQDSIYLGLAWTTKEMTWPADFATTYTGWSFPSIWKIAPSVNGGYPQFTQHLLATLLSGKITGTSTITGMADIRGLLLVAGTISSKSDWRVLMTKLLALRGQIDAMSWWQAYRALMQIWAKREGKYERVTPYVKTGGVYQPVAQVLRKSDSEWKV